MGQRLCEIYDFFQVISLFQYSEEFVHLTEMVETCEFFMETFMQFFLQWYLVYVKYYDVIFASSSQLFSIWKSLFIFPLGFAKLFVPQIFYEDQTESLLGSTKRKAWSVNFIFVLTMIFFDTFQISVLYLFHRGKGNPYFSLPFAITCVFLLTVLVCEKLFQQSWGRLRCVAFTFLFLVVGA